MATSNDTISEERLEYLMQAYVRQTLSTKERTELLAFLEIRDNESRVQPVLDSIIRTFPHSDTVLPALASEMIIESILGTQITTTSHIPFLKSASSLTMRWASVAAAILIIFGIGAYLWFNKNPSVNSTSSTEPLAGVDIVPGSNKAILTLADGTTITLDSAVNGAIAQQGNSSVVKLDDGKLVYKYDRGSYPPSEGVARSAGGGLATYNTMSTPRGGQYQLTLSDGTKVWLNASSSITFPATFTGNKRNVSITGEAYFEVAKNASRPFIVKINEQSTITVLGTHFNVSAYNDEAEIKTTLLEGRVEVQNALQKQVLAPGQQARINNGMKVISNVNTEQAVAWKNGLFNFREADLKDVMRQLSRWYDVDIVYEKGVKEMKFYGKMGRDLSLNQVLSILQKSDVHFIIEGKKLIVKP